MPMRLTPPREVTFFEQAARNAEAVEIIKAYFEEDTRLMNPVTRQKMGFEEYWQLCETTVMADDILQVHEEAEQNDRLMRERGIPDDEQTELSEEEAIKQSLFSNFMNMARECPLIPALFMAPDMGKPEVVVMPDRLKCDPNYLNTLNMRVIQLFIQKFEDAKQPIPHLNADNFDCHTTHVGEFSRNAHDALWNSEEMTDEVGLQIVAAEGVLSQAIAYRTRASGENTKAHYYRGLNLN